VNSTGTQTYNYLHPIKNETDGYYRIKVINKDGAIDYSTIKKVRAERNATKLAAYPNPTTGLFTLQLPAGTQGVLSLKVYDNAGKLVMQKKLTAQAGTREIPFDISAMAAGYYRVVCENDNKLNTVSVLKRK